MDKTLFVIDNFYQDPDEIRNQALSREFHVKGNYPGTRTDAVAMPTHEELGKFIQNRIIHQHISYWPDGYNTAFQYTTEDEETWVHHDATMWAGVLYLTPNPPSDSGTTLYRRKSTGVYKWDGVEDSDSDYNKDWDAMKNLEEWEPEITIQNRYNRLIIYQGALYHRSTTAGFGDCKENGRLFQTFFFDTI